MVVEIYQTDMDIWSEPVTGGENMSNVIIPEHYHSCLSRYETQEAIGFLLLIMIPNSPCSVNIQFSADAHFCGFDAYLAEFFECMPNLRKLIDS